MSEWISVKNPLPPLPEGFYTPYLIAYKCRGRDDVIKVRLGIDRL